MREIKKIVEDKQGYEQEKILKNVFDQIMEIQFTRIDPVSGANLTYMLGNSIGVELNAFLIKYFEPSGRDMMLQAIKKHI